MHFLTKYIKKFLLVLFGVALSQQCVSINTQKRLQHYIFIPGELGAQVKEAVKDMAASLEQATGYQFAIETSQDSKTSGIHLLWANDAKLSKDTRNKLKEDGQSFYIKADDHLNARIIGTGTNSFCNGIYTFLQELGFRWYMPGDIWTVVPKLSDATPGKKIDKIYKLDFRNRFYGGSGGLRPIPGVDPQNTFKKDYDQWNIRNRFSSDQIVKGHSGQYFYSAKSKQLNDNPDLFCTGKIDKYGRIDIAKPKAVNLFVEWALEQIKSGDEFPVIGVDPSDGSGGSEDCLPENMPGIHTWSDKYFWLANKVAEKLPEESNAIVQLYAYAAHAAPPGFDVNEKVYPVIIPYAFQRVATPTEFIKQWSQKLRGRPMGVYDYWNITQWSVGVPQFDIYTIPQKLRLWQKHNITTISLETTNAKGPMGHAFWLASQMMWNTGLSFDSLYNAFLTDCFGAASADVRRMYDRWSLNYQSAMDVDLSLQDLAKASGKITSPVVKQRLSELKAYVHYLKLYYEYEANPTVSGYNKLIGYMHRIHSLRLVHTWALQTYYIKKPKNYLQPPVAGAKRSGEITKERIYDDIESEFKADLAASDFAYDVPAFKLDITKLERKQNAKGSEVSFITGPNEYQFYIPRSTSFKIRAGCTIASKLTISDDQQNIVYEKNIPASKAGYIEVSVQLKPGKYSMLTGILGGFTRVQFPDDIVFISSGEVIYYDNAGFPLLYIYVPQKATEIIYEDKYGPGVNKRGFWLNPEGNKVNAEKLKNEIYRVPVPRQFRGKVWVLSIGHRAFHVLNISSKFSLSDFNYKED